MATRRQSANNILNTLHNWDAHSKDNISKERDIASIPLEQGRFLRVRLSLGYYCAFCILRSTMSGYLHCGPDLFLISREQTCTSCTIQH